MLLSLPYRSIFIHLVQVPLLILLADFITGIFHWLEDSYGNEDFPVIGKNVTQPNLLHHRKPREFLKNSWLRSADVPLVLAAFFISGLWALGWLNWQTVFVTFILINANEIHKWTHQSRKEKPKLAHWLHRFKLVQSAKGHAKHHSGNMNTHYCTVTDYLNPLLEKINLWRRFEKVIKKVTGKAPRNWIVLKRKWKENI